MRVKSFHHICIQTEDYDASMRFYTELLGFELIKETAGFHTRDFNSWLRGGGVMIELQTPKHGTSFKSWSKLNAGPVHFALVVDDVRAAYDELKVAGWNHFKRKNGTEVYEVCGSSLFKVLAPEGTEIEIRDDPEIG